MTVTRRFASPLIFLVLATGVYTVAFYLRGILADVDSPEVLAGALAFDLVVFVPAMYYLLIARPCGWPVISVAGVFVLSLVAAAQIIPPEHRTILTPLEILAGVTEVLILSFIVWKANRGIRRFRAAAARQRHDDAFEAIRAAARQVIDSERVALVFAYEIGIFYYAFGSWRQRFKSGSGRFTSYKRNSYGSILAGIGALLIVELIGVHILVQHYWGTAGAWIVSILTAYAGVWLLAEWQTHRLRPILITDGGLVLRAGIRWEIEIPLARIRSFRRISALEEKPRGGLDIAVGGALFEVTTHDDVVAHGAYGIRKSARCFWFSVDDPADFEEELSRRL